MKSFEAFTFSHAAAAAELADFKAMLAAKEELSEVSSSVTALAALLFRHPGHRP